MKLYALLSVMAFVDNYTVQKRHKEEHTIHVSDIDSAVILTVTYREMSY